MTDQPGAPDPETPTSELQTDPSDPEAGDNALERADRSIQEALDAEAEVASHGDITTADDERAGKYSEEPDGATT